MHGLSEHERYRFDLDGFVVRRQVLDRSTLDELRRAVAGLSLPPAGPSIASQRFRGHLAEAACFRDLLDHESVLDLLVDLCGASVRLDHAYGLVMAPGTSGLGLHGGGTPHDPSQFYAVHDGRLSNGLVAVMWPLVDHPPGWGGFCCIPGSHRANFALPNPTPDEWVVDVAMAAGDVVVFTEALTHGTRPWTGPGDRLALFNKYAPGHLAWGPDYTDLAALVPLLGERQRLLVQPPAIHGHRPVV